MKVANLQRMGSFPAVATNRASRRDFAKQANMFNEIARRNAQRTEVAKGKEQLIFRMKASEIERKPKPVVVEMPKPSIYAPLRRAAVILLSIVGLAIAGETMGQINMEKIRDPEYIKRVYTTYCQKPTDNDAALTYATVGSNVMKDIRENSEHKTLKQALEQTSFNKFNTRERERYGLALFPIWIWYLENKPRLTGGMITESQFRSELDQQVNTHLKDFLKPQQQKQPDAPVAVKLTMGQ